ncbi:MAG: rRNA maturation RNase YbeY [Gammaproteobacteria bacterium]
MAPPEPDIQYCSRVERLPGVDKFSAWAGCVNSLLPAKKNKQLQARNFVVRLVDEDEMRSLNKRWRKKDYPTNVLAFPFDAEMSAAHIPLGDVVICAPIVESEACEQGKPFVDRMAHMFVHGLLHLLGYDHQSPEQASKMEQIEREALARLGYAKPYESE